ncbi:stabilin-1 [Bombina bombina]|uniref:stabilin-1 n=1 Tax=Bombina bombina TaxID=8345 RepID=UPI00235A9098|nr:stabilin-1 [Bombina bombina]
MLLSDITFAFLMVYITSITAVIGLIKKSRCDVSKSVSFDTDCTSCAANLKVMCPSTKVTSGKGKRGCRYTVNTGGVTLSLVGCQQTCRSLVVERQCCKGFWGSNCNECPGGSENPCTGHGACFDGINGNGTCVCNDGFSGDACEDCSDDNLYGPNCSSACDCKHGVCNNGITGDGSCICTAGFTGPQCDQEDPPCKTLNCGYSSRCVLSTLGRLMCGCMPGYSKKNTNSCKLESACKPSSCSRDAVCMSTGPQKFKCMCKTNFYGKTCKPFNPCTLNNGGCIENSTRCKYQGPGRSYCSCNPGMVTKNISAGCYFPPTCSINVCDKSANCEVSATGKKLCLCENGEIGDGKACYGNILHQIQMINMEPPFRKKITGALRIFEEGCALALRKHGPFTILVPTMKIQEMNETLAKEICKVHIIPGQHLLEDLTETRKLQTLSGDTLDFPSTVFKTKDGKFYQILKANQPASNGVIHIINKVIKVDSKENYGNTKMTIGDILAKREEFNRFETMLENCGLPPILNNPGSFTVFVPTNKAVDALRDGRLIFLFTQAKHKLLALVKNHIVSSAAITVDRLITMPYILTSANEALHVNITENGQITLGDSGSILQQNDIIASNGIIHIIDDTLIPSSILPILPHQCNETRYEIIKGTCSSCDSVAPCPDDSTDLGTVEKECILQDSNNSTYGCARLCNQTVTEIGCCKGFFGPDCKPCPAGFSEPCYGRGTCNDGMRGNGKCQCFEKFKGTVCHICSNLNKHGHDCEEDCKCLHGTCDNRPGSNGVCQGGRCLDGYTGIFCDQHSEPCGISNITQNCHVNARCEIIDGSERCVCSDEFKGDGSTCVPKNLCEQPDRGGCSENGICIYVGPGHATCKCNSGWSGDGIECLPIDNCALESRGGCHDNATCNYIQPGENDCTCKRGYAGDGYFCDMVDLCLENNGGCHDMAQCKLGMNRERTCTCPEGFAGDGLICYGDILTELSSNPDLYIFNQWIKSSQLKIPQGTNVTAFIPSDVVIKGVSEEQKKFWLDPYRLPFLVRSHFLQGVFTSDQLKLYDGKELSTLDPRTKWDVAHINGSITINNASTIITDIPAINGFIFIINKILIPPLGSIPPQKPTLTQQLKQMPAFSKFKEAIENFGLAEEIESSEQKYTIFVPGNSAILEYYNESGIEQMDNNTIKYHIILGFKLLPADLKNGIHKDSMLGSSYWLIFYERDNKTFVHDVPLQGTFFETKNGILIGISSVLKIHKNRCDTSTEFVNQTKCGDCMRKIKCPKGTTLKETSIRGCTYKRRSRITFGCLFQCIRSDEVSQCCKGYFGHQCLMCPGGQGNWCSNNGNCTDGITGNGECICKMGFHGTACEMCEPGKYGNDCQSECKCKNGTCNDGILGDGTCQCEKGWSGHTCDRDIKNDLCNDTCDIYANCIVDAKNSTTCTCIAGFSGNGTHCSEIHTCTVNRGGCSQYATCKRVSAGLRTCTCMVNYTGDGIICNEIDACLENNGGCDRFAECIKTGPNKVACNCRTGYEGDGKNLCNPINLCYKNKAECSPFASCSYEGPGEFTCKCKSDYVGDGRKCTGNIVQELRYNQQTTFFYQMLQSEVIKDLQGNGPYTVFIPEHEVIYNSSMIKEWRNTKYLKNLLRYHMVGCQQLLLSDLAEQTSLTTLSGGILNVSSKADGVYLNDLIKITQSDLIATNGVIHLIENILVPEIKNNTKTSEKQAELNITEAAEIYGYSMFIKLLKDSNLLSLLNLKIHQPFTMLWPTDEAFNSLPEERRNWLYHSSHRDKLEAYLKVHIIRDTKLIAANLPQANSIRTMHGSTISFECSKKNIGEIIVNENDARIVQRNMEFKYGIAHGIDQLLEPPNIGARCDNFTEKEIEKPLQRCSDCGSYLTCPSGSYDTGELTFCVMKRPAFQHSHHIYSGYSRRFDQFYPSYMPYNSIGCSKKCVTVVWTPQCCKNHYGSDCQVCPGGLESPCSDHGSCDDGLAGTGTCKCSKGFNGTACEICSPGRYGPNCEVCRCTDNGKCIDGISGDGSCFCNEGWSGQKCGIKLNVKPVCSPACDDNGTCRANNTCICNPYYDGDGRSCTVIDMCKDQNGGCSIHANCTQVGVDVSCNCFSDYEGDGIICSPIDLCANGNNGGCNEHATCINIGANLRRCECHDGFVGNGIQCLEKVIPPVDRCLEENGGCHSLAECTDLHFQEKTAGVFHLQSPKGKYQFTYKDAEDACVSEGASIATFSQLSGAQQMGFHLCLVGWLSNQTAGYPTTSPNPSCGSGHVGIVDYKQRSNINEKYDVYCFRDQDVQCTCGSGYVGDGIYCNGNLLEVLEDNFQFSVFYSLLLDYANATDKGVEFLDFLSNGTFPKTLFVPEDGSFEKNVTLTWRDLEHHVSDVFQNYANLTNSSVLVSKLGYNLSISDHTSANCNATSCPKVVNNKVIVSWDIPAFNGIIHVIKGPLIAPLVQEARKDPINHPITMGVVASLVTVFIVIAVTAGFFYYKQQNKGFRFRQFKAEEDEDDTYINGNVNPPLVSIPNPVYGASNAFFEPFEDSFDDKDNQDVLKLFH